MTLHTVTVNAVPPQPWRNGGGRTRALWAWPDAVDWRVRVSVAEIERDGPFSAYPGVRRWFTVVEGAGVTLDFPTGSHHQLTESPPLAFDGAAPPGCRLVHGPTSDLNLMVRGGDGSMECVVQDTGWRSGAMPSTAQCGLYCRTPGVLHRDDAPPVDVRAHTLLWCDDLSDASWRFTAAAGSASPVGWWLRYCPDRAAR